MLSGTPSGVTGTTLSFTFNATDGNGTVTTSGTITADTLAYTFTAFTFTSAGQTGRTGPTLATLQSSYSATAFTQNTSYLNVTTQGIQRWTVPGSGTYRIQCVGAVGGNSMHGVTWGYGASMQGDFSLTGGEIVNILVGQGGVGAATGGPDIAPAAGGGGGSFVWRDSSSAEPLIAAGGGAGGTDQPRTGAHGANDRHKNIDASTGTAGKVATRDGGIERGGQATGGAGGVVANTGSDATALAGAGAGYKGNGAANGNGNVASSPANGGTGGLCITNENNRNANNAGLFHGGFGGGGGAAGWYGCSGGGGGYSGGSTGDDSPRVAGGGGGSYNAGTNQVNTANANTSGGATGASGYVVITKL